MLHSLISIVKTKKKKKLILIPSAGIRINYYCFKDVAINRNSQNRRWWELEQPAFLCRYETDLCLCAELLAGIIVAAALFSVAVIAIAVWFHVRRKKSKNLPVEPQPPPSTVSVIMDTDTKTIGINRFISFFFLYSIISISFDSIWWMAMKKVIIKCYY